MFRDIRRRTFVESGLRFPRVALALALVAAFAGGARTFALDDKDHKQEQDKNEQGRI